MQADIEFNILMDEQKGKIVALRAVSPEKVSFIKNKFYKGCSVADFVRLLGSANDLKRVCVLGLLTLLNNAGVTTESLREKGAIVSLADFVLAFKALKDSHDVYKNNNIKTLETMSGALENIIEKWSNGSLAQYDQVLFQEINSRAINIMKVEWHEHSKCTDVELVEILHKRITSHVEDQICAYLGDLAPVRADNPADTDCHAVMLGSLNRRIQISDAERVEYLNGIISHLHKDYFVHGNQVVELYKHIKKIRDNKVLTRFQNNNLSENKSGELDEKLSRKIMAAISDDPKKFSQDSPLVSTFLSKTSAELKGDMAVNDFSEYNKSALVKLLSNFKSAQSSNEQNMEIMTHLLPLVEELKFDAEEENAIVLEAVQTIANNPHELVDMPKAQFVVVVKNVIGDYLRTITKDATNQAGRDLISSFCVELLSLLNSVNRDRYFKRAESISLLFNSDERLLIESVLALSNNFAPQFYQNPPVVTTITEASCPEQKDIQQQSGPSK